MPKEITYSNQPEYILRPDGSEVNPVDISGRGFPVLRRAAIVGWSKEQGHVEIGINSLEIATQHGSTDSGMYATFDRAGINRLIRTLRKARDDAFGRDE
jgi:hypothetical protein